MFDRRAMRHEGGHGGRLRLGSETTKALTWAVFCVASAGCSGPPRDATIKASCDCIDPNGGVFAYPYEYGNQILCISHDEAQQQCAPLLNPSYSPMIETERRCRV